MKLRSRLFVTFLSIIVLGSSSLYISMRATTESLVRSFTLDSDRAAARRLADGFSRLYSPATGWAGLDPGVFASGERYALLDDRGLVIMDTTGSWLGSVHPDRHRAEGFSVMASGKIVGTVFAGTMIDPSLGGSGDAFLASINRALLFASLVSALLAALLATIFSIGISRPLDRLGRAVRRVAEGDLSSSVPVSGDKELATLASDFNRMTEALKRLEEARRRLIADSAHELRTPVTLIRGGLEAMIDGVYPTDTATLLSIHEETLRLSRLIDTLRELELIDSGKLILEKEMTDPKTLVAACLTLFRKEAEDREIHLGFNLESANMADTREDPRNFTAGWLLDRHRIAEVIRNLVSNALRYTPNGGSVLVSTFVTDTSDATCSMTTKELPEVRKLAMYVEDSGPGVPEGERERIFDRYYRVEKSRSAEHGGRGLGLSIAREIVRAHGGSIACASSPKLGGCLFMVVLPDPCVDSPTGD